MKTSLRISTLFCLQLATIAQPVQTQSLQGHVPAAVAHLTPVGRLEAARELKLAIGLPLRNKEGLTNLLQRIYDPTSPDYHHYLTPAQFAETFGPTEEDYRAAMGFATANGLKVTATHPNRALLDVVGSVSNIEKAFHVTMRTYSHPREKRVFYAPDVEPSLDLATPVLHIGGLDNYLLPHPMSLRKKPLGGSAGAVPASGSGPGGAYMGNDFRAAYVPGLALTGTGQSVGLLEFDSGYYQSDIAAYESLAGLPNVPVKAVLLDGYDGAPGYGNDEVSLDIEMAISMAPGLASVIVYEGDVTDDILNRMATDGLANQLSASWTYGIDAVTDQIFQQFAAQGQSFFNASGDSDAYTADTGIPTPADDPNITSVGGTTLTTTGPGGAWLSETVWNWGVEYGTYYDGTGGSGGISTTYPIPAWQLGVNMTANQGSTTFRNIPDVALTADNVFVVFGDGESGSFGGTSCATPLWAAFVALANEQAVANGRPVLGFINPAIYALGLSVNYTSCFHDITTGNNTWSESPTNFYAVPGYDLCTGWGTPMGSNLVNVLAPPGALQISPLGGWASSGGVAGPLTPASQTYALTNCGNAALNWAAAATVPWLDVSLSGGALTPGGAAASVVVSLNAAAGNLFLGTYGATIWFTNLTDGTAQSRPFALTIIKPPVITAQPASLTLIGGTTAAFTAGAAGGLPLNCQWQRNGINVTNNGRVSGAQTTLTDEGNIYGSVVSTLTINNVAATDGGTYSLVASNAAGVVVSSNAVLTVTPSGPVIIQQPASQTVFVGATVQLAVVVDGSAPFTYQWKLNQTNLSDGGAVSGSATPTLTITGASSASIGTYTVVVSNAISTATTTGAVLAVEVAAPGGQLVQNLGFETGSFSSWSETGNFIDCSVSGSSPAVHSGSYGALLGSAGSLGYLSQTLPTVTGQLYLLSLWLDSPDGLSPNEFLVAWNGTVRFDQTNLGAIGWTNLQFYVMATGTNTSLEFGFRDDESFLGLDDIQVSPAVSADGPPIIATQPANQAALAGGTATFSVLSSGRFPLFYQWQFDTTNIANATNATLTLSNLTTNQAGSYCVVVSNSLGSAISSNALLTVLTGSPALITFDDLTGTGMAVPEGYNNLTWNNFYYLDPATVGGPSGYAAGMISAPNVAYNRYGTPAAISAATPFALISAYLTAAWNDNLRVELKGYNGAALIYDNTYTLSATNPTLITFNYMGVTSVQFLSSGGTPHLGYLENGENFVMDNVTVAPPPPPPMAVLCSFNGPDGGNPSAALVQGSDGNFYGTTQYGGTYGEGTVFRMTTNGTLTTLLSFAYTNGAYPQAWLVQGADGNFYGTTSEGGTYGDGTVFRLTTNGTLTNLVSFNYSVNGSSPYAGLLQGADGNFYGTTADGGANYDGTVFRMTTNGTLTTLASFNYTNGASPYGGLVQSTDGNFYGTTAEGGTYGDGTVFRLTTNGTLTNLVSFNYSVNGGYPYAGLLQGADGNFYGTTADGGENYDGTVFRMTTNYTLTTVASFNYANGAYPYAGLVQGADGNFYGTTEDGGYGNGTVFMFRMTTNGTIGTLTPLLSFRGTNGAASRAGLAQGADGNFYGTTFNGGLGFNGASYSGDGIIFRLGAGPTATTPAIIAQPVSQIVPVSSAAIFSVNASGAAPLSYSWQLNGSPIAGAAQSSYATNNVQLTDSGGQYSCVISNAYGSVTSSNAALTVFNASGPLFSFNGPDGGYSSAALVQGANGNFYGTTQYGGTYGEGTVFRITTNGTLTTLVSFDYANGAEPYGGLVQGADGNFYGTTAEGGTYGAGTVFRMTANGTLTNLVSFNYSGNGSYPYAGLLQGADGNFYGTTSEGGTNYDGTVFRMTTAGTLTTLASFNYANGAEPYAGLVQGADGNLYGTTEAGGTYGKGTVFRMSGNGTLLTNLFSFAATNGAAPQAALVQGSDGNLYGTTTYGGNTYDGDFESGNGTVFRLVGAIITGPPLIVTQPASQTVGVGSTATFCVTAEGSLPLNYYWRRNGVPIAGATAFCYTTNNVQLSDSGSQFSCLVSNAYGTALSSTGVLTVVTNLPTDWFTELFDATITSIMAFKTFTFTPDGSANFYTVCSGPALAFPTDPTGGTVLNEGDDTYLQITLSGTNTVAIYTNRTNVIYVGSNGYLTMNAGDTSYSPSYASHFGVPRVSALYRDLNPGSGGTVSWKQLADHIAVTYQAVPIYGSGTQTNSFQVELFFDGRIRITYLSLNAPTGLVGLSAGAGQPANFVPSEFTTYPSCVLQPPSISVQPTNQTVPSGYNVTFAVGAYGSPPLSYEWLQNGTPILGATNASYTTNNVPLSASGSQFSCVVSNAYGITDSQVATLTVLALPPTITQQPVNQTDWVGSGATFSLTATGSLPLSYYWQRNGAYIAGATATSYTTNNVQLADSGSQFSCLVSNAYGSTVSSNAMLTVTTNSVLIATTNSWDEANFISDFGYPNTGTYGQTFVPPSQSSVLTSFTVYIENTSAYVNFQFYVMAWQGSEATGPILYQSPETTTAGTSGFQAYTFNTGSLAMTPGATYVAFGSITADFTGQAVWGSPTNYPYTNGCFVFNNNGTDFSLLTNSAWSSYSTEDLAFVAVFGGGSGGTSPPTITQQPASQSVVVGASVTFSVAAIGTAPLSYFWQRNGVFIAAATNSTYTTNNVQLSDSGSQFSCLVSNAYGTTLSSSAVLTVEPCGSPTVINFDDVAAPANFIQTMPLTNQYAALGVIFAGPGGLDGGAILNSNGDFQVTGFSGSNFLAFNANSTLSDGGVPRGPETISFSQPQSSVSLLAGSGLSAGQTLTVSAYNTGNVLLTASTITLASALAPVQVAGNGISQVVVSSPAAVFVLDNLTFAPVCVTSPPSIFMQPTNLTVPLGNNATFTVGASGTAPLSYFWHRNGVFIAAATNSIYTTNDVQLSDSGSQFSCLVSNAYGTALSSNAVLTVTPPSLVQNGGFELGSFAYWTTSGNFESSFVTLTAPYVHSGVYGAELGPGGTLGYISQTLATTVGQRYLVSCWLYCDGETPNEFSVSWNGATLFDQQNVADTLWTNLQFQASATATNTVLTFGFQNNPSYFGLDDIAVNPISVPPPQFQSVTLTNGTISFSWSAQAGQLYQVQYTTNLTQIYWTNLGGVLSTTSSSITITDATAASAQRFYRIVLLP